MSGIETEWTLQVLYSSDCWKYVEFKLKMECSRKNQIAVQYY